MNRGPLLAAALAGLLVGGATVAVLAQRKGAQLELRGRMLSASLTTQGSALQTLLTAQGAAMEPRLAAYAMQAAEEHLRDGYGITPERIAAAQRLMARWGIS